MRTERKPGVYKGGPRRPLGFALMTRSGELKSARGPKRHRHWRWHWHVAAAARRRVPSPEAPRRPGLAAGAGPLAVGASAGPGLHWQEAASVRVRVRVPRAVKPEPGWQDGTVPGRSLPVRVAPWGRGSGEDARAAENDWRWQPEARPTQRLGAAAGPRARASYARSARRLRAGGGQCNWPLAVAPRWQATLAAARAHPQWAA